MPVNDLRQSCVAGVRAFLSSRAPERSWSLEFLCERGRIVSRNRHATFELWSEERQHADLDLRVRRAAHVAVPVEAA